VRVDTFKCTYLTRLNLSITATSHERQNFLTSLQTFEQGDNTQEYPQYIRYYEQTKPFLLFPRSSPLFTMEMNGVQWNQYNKSLYCVLQATLQQQLINCEGKNSTLKNQKRGIRVQWHFCKCAVDHCFEHEVRMLNRQTYTQIPNDYYLQTNSLTTATNPYIFSPTTGLTSVF
jgi:hypothetical protein